MNRKFKLTGSQAEGATPFSRRERAMPRIRGIRTGNPAVQRVFIPAMKIITGWCGYSYVEIRSNEVLGISDFIYGNSPRFSPPRSVDKVSRDCRVENLVGSLLYCCYEFIRWETLPSVILINTLYRVHLLIMQLQCIRIF